MMAAESVEAEPTCLCPQHGFLADLPTSDLINQWNLSSCEFLKPRSTDKALTIQQEILQVEGEIP